jgi:hypothetical protein
MLINKASYPGSFFLLLLENKVAVASPTIKVMSKWSFAEFEVIL